MDSNWKVYRHIFPNGKSYIGITHRAVEDRWGKNGERYNGQIVGKAIDKYGWENIQHIILKENLNQQQASYYEQQYIKVYKSHISQNGYNVTWGGEGGTTLNYEAVYNAWLKHSSLDYVANLFHCNKDTVRKILDNYNVPKNSRAAKANGQKINQYDLSGKYLNTYDSYKEAARITGFYESGIRKCAQGKINSCKGFIWRDYNGDNSDLVDINIKGTNRGSPAFPINQYDLNNNYIQSFPSAAAAAQWLNKKSAKTPILLVCKGERKTAYNYIWKFKKES